MFSALAYFSGFLLVLSNFANLSDWHDRFDSQQVDMVKRNNTEQDQREGKMQTLLKAEEQLREFKNAKMVKKKEIENEENRYKMLLSLDNQVQK